MRVITALRTCTEKLARAVTGVQLGPLASVTSRRALNILSSLGSTARAAWRPIPHQFLRQVRWTSDLAALACDLIMPNRPMNAAIAAFDQTHRRISFPGDGKSCSRSLAFGLLTGLAQLNPSQRLTRLKALMTGVQARERILEDALTASSPLVLDTLSSQFSNLQTALETLAQEPNSEVWLEADARSAWLCNDQGGFRVILAIKILCSLYGLCDRFPGDIDRQNQMLSKGKLGVAGDNAVDFAQKMAEFGSRRWPISECSEFELQGFCQLFGVEIAQFPLLTIGNQALRAPLAPPGELVANLCERTAPRESCDLPPVHLVRYRVHFDAAIPL